MQWLIESVHRRTLRHLIGACPLCTAPRHPHVQLEHVKSSSLRARARPLAFPCPSRTRNQRYTNKTNAKQIQTPRPHDFLGCTFLHITFGNVGRQIKYWLSWYIQLTYAVGLLQQLMICSNRRAQTEQGESQSLIQRAPSLAPCRHGA